MKISSCKPLSRDHKELCLICGVFDPVTSSHISLFKDLVEYSNNWDMTPSIAFFTPKPAILLKTKGGLEYHDISSRIKIIDHETRGLVHPVLVEMSVSDLEEGAESFVSSVNEYLRIGELWLGSNQTFGTGTSGLFHSIDTITRRLGIGLKLLPRHNKIKASLLCEALHCNHFQKAIDIIGYPPMFSSSSSRNHSARGWRATKHKLTAYSAEIKPCFPERSYDVSFYYMDGQVVFDWPNEEDELLACTSNLD